MCQSAFGCQPPVRSSIKILVDPFLAFFLKGLVVIPSFFFILTEKMLNCWKRCKLFVKIYNRRVSTLSELQKCLNWQFFCPDPPKSQSTLHNLIFLQSHSELRFHWENQFLKRKLHGWLETILKNLPGGLVLVEVKDFSGVFNLLNKFKFYIN